ncbi:hypothetical protein K435DRAFT_806114 [Dendrothele bispora CBS 962.96]|uniref:Uncharacterized protein n=1 Tax=Dendrothele bispora (strain CBS 962.96) TaxID=1314807 RepID=A0A4S8L9D3_DENBC|nr:hypothetical protein K435DRAFT_806114 [Dendrothele bispora CBS 962.96]
MQEVLADNMWTKFMEEPNFTELHSGRAIDLPTLGLMMLGYEVEKQCCTFYILGKADKFFTLISYVSHSVGISKEEPFKVSLTYEASITLAGFGEVVNLLVKSRIHVGITVFIFIFTFLNIRLQVCW